FAMSLGDGIAQMPLAHASGALVGIACGLLAGARDHAHALDALRIRSVASRSVSVDDANENRTESLPDGPNAAPGIAATPACSSMIRQTSSALAPVSATFTQA